MIKEEEPQKEEIEHTEIYWVCDSDEEEYNMGYNKALENLIKRLTELDGK